MQRDTVSRAGEGAPETPGFRRGLCPSASMAFPSLRHVTAVLVTIGAILDPRFAASQSSERSASKLDSATSDRVKHGDEGRQQVIVRVRPGELTKVTTQLREKGHAISHAHGVINALTVSIPIDEIEALSRQSSVLSISVDAVVTADQSDSSYTLRSTLGLPAQSPTGNRIGVAVVDSGIEPGPEFGDRLVGFYDFTNGGRTVQPTDGYGHGTHVAGIIAGDGGLSQKRYRGVAPKARLTGFKVLDANGTGLTSDVISAIEYVTEHKDSLGIDIINLSLGHPIYEPAARPARSGRRSGITRGNRRRHVGRQLRSQSGDRPSGIRRHRVARQRALGDHRRRRHDVRHEHSQRRSRREVQLARTLVVRRHRKARSRRAWTRPRVGRGAQQHALLEQSWPARR